MRNKKIKVFYTPNQVCEKNIWEGTSRSPLKPKLVVEQLTKLFPEHFEIDGTFAPYDKQDFLVAHTPDYVERYFKGEAGGNGITWSPELADSVRYTNASIYNAIRHSIENPGTVCFSPTSGFHHARPEGGGGFCTFSGQVIASVKLYRELGLSGAYFDLDGHFGNSIEDSRHFVPDLNDAVPVGFNVNPNGSNGSYVSDLKKKLEMVKQAILQGDIHYVVWCHGADSHADDDLGHQCDTEHWLECSKVFFEWVKEMDSLLIHPLPVAMALFGGYRRDSYESVINLHTADIVQCLNTLCGAEIQYVPEVKAKPKMKFTHTWYERSGHPSWDKTREWIRSLNDKPKPKPLSKNERLVLEYLESLEDDAFRSGLALGAAVKGWKKHSVAKWCKKLVRRGLVEKGPGGYRLKQEEVQDEPVQEVEKDGLFNDLHDDLDRNGFRERFGDLSELGHLREEDPLDDGNDTFLDDEDESDMYNH